MPRKADLLSTIWLTGAFLSATLLVGALALLYRFGTWSFPAMHEKLALVGLFVAAAVLVAIPCAGILWISLAGLDRLTAWLSRRTVFLFTIPVSIAWLRLVKSRS